ncbi:hypothetical protein [Blastococcus goldschmidtiae]|uniref:Uncharacterized protein n=1 Tax=Blastococcus goldschmidtiae TaxID=3075546 RepID=A0ABU2K9L7_9ACTN|nr:hypothetical protein [Blastococcus sp. DSM 46792]MDT0276889.1 hypothetical protein [Blastococcus sp. DSM 46792]
MIVAAGLLVLGGLGLFVAGVLTDVTALYWACVGACVVAAVLLYLARRRLRAQAATAPATTALATTAPAGTAPAGTAPATAAPVTAAPAGAAPATAAPAGGRSGRHAGDAEEPATRPAAATAPGGAGVPEPAPAAGADGPAPPAEPRGTDAPALTPAEEPAAEAPTAEVPAAGATAASLSAGTTAGTTGEPPVEEVEVTDLLLVVDLRDEVLVVDEHPRYHVAGCRHLTGQETIPLPVDEAKTDGFTPCGSCRPDATLADRVRARRGSAGG